jgi:hypothetical protein
VQQRREQPDCHGFPAAQDRQTSPVQAYQRSDQRTRHEPAQNHDGIRQPAIPHLSGKQPDVEQRKWRAGSQEGAADLRCQYMKRSWFRPVP